VQHFEQRFLVLIPSAGHVHTQADAIQSIKPPFMMMNLDEDVPTSSDLLEEELGDLVLLPLAHERSLELSLNHDDDFVLLEGEGSPMLLLHLGLDLLQHLCVSHLSQRDVLALSCVCKSLRRMISRGRSLWHALLMRDYSFVLEGERRRCDALGLAPAWTVFARREALTAEQLKGAYLRAKQFVGARDRPAIPCFVIAFDFSARTAIVWDALDVMTGTNCLSLRTGHSVSVVVHLQSTAPRLHLLTCLSRWSYGLEMFRSLLGLSGHPSPVAADRARTQMGLVENASGRPEVFAAQLAGHAHGVYQLWSLPRTTVRKSYYQMLVYADQDTLVDQYPGCSAAATGAPLEPCYRVTIKFES
jgi:hypothetical protein